MLEIDGSMMEGGGQILRMSASLSAILGTPIRITNIRAGRSSPGLKAQHLTGINLVRDICSGRLDGGTFGSTEISFHPGRISGGEFWADTKSAGAVCLLAQITLPCTLFSPKSTVLNLKGGTNADMAPQIDEFTEVFLPNLEKFGAKFEFEVVRKGFYPKGGGEVNFYIEPVKQLTPITMLNPGQILSVEGWSFSAGSLPVKVAEVIANACKQELRDAKLASLQGVKINLEAYKEVANSSWGNGSGIVIVAKTSTGCILGGSALGSPKVRAEDTGRKAAQELLEAIECGGCVDKYIQDQMIIFMALAEGESSLKTGPLTLHTESAIHVAEKLTGAKFSVSNDAENSNSWIIQCKGVGFKNPNL